MCVYEDKHSGFCFPFLSSFYITNSNYCWGNIKAKNLNIGIKHWWHNEDFVISILKSMHIKGKFHRYSHGLINPLLSQAVGNVKCKRCYSV